MRKITALVLIATLVLALSACGGNEPSASSDPTTATAPTTGSRPTEGTPIGLSTLKGQGATTTFKGYTTTASTATTTTTAATTTAAKLRPVLDKPYVCQMTGGIDLIVATVTFSEELCVIDRTFYTCNPEHAAYGTDVPTITLGSRVYYRTSYAAQPAALYEINGIHINVMNGDGSIGKTFVMSSTTTIGCSFSDGIAFGRNNNFTLEE